MKMYVTNCTQQSQDFTYRLPEAPGAMRQTIPIGGYIRISGDLNQPQIDAIVKQHARYGMVAESEVDRTKAFIGLYYTVDREPRVGRMYEAIAHNVDVLEERGRNLRMEAAIVTNNVIRENSPPGSLRELEMSVVEERSGGKEVIDNPSIAEGVRVTNDHQGPPAVESRAEQRRRQRRRAA
jgi:hypothetical protein